MSMSKKRLIYSCLAAALVFSAAAPAHADLFGESDEEKAAREQHENGQDSQINQLSQRLHDLEESLRQQTGQNEALAHRIQELNDRIDRQQKDFEYRLCTLAGQQLGAGDQSGGALPCNPSASSANTYSAPPQNVPPPARLAPGPGGSEPCRRTALQVRRRPRPRTRAPSSMRR